MRLSSSLVTAFVGLALLGSCSKSEEQKEQACVNTALALTAPTGTEPGAVLLKEIPTGTFAISRIETRVEGDGLVGAFTHQLGKVGAPSRGDSTCKTFKGKVEEGKEARMNAELSIAKQIVSSESELAFDDVRYYWNQVTSENGWSWAFNNKNKVGGNSPLAAFADGNELAAKLYKSGITQNGALVSLFQVSGDSLILTFRVSQGDRSLLAKVTYQKVSTEVSEKETEGIKMTVQKVKAAKVEEKPVVEEAPKVEEKTADPKAENKTEEPKTEIKPEAKP